MNEYKTKEQKAKFYNSWAWRKLRKVILENQNYECVWCKEEGKVTTQDVATLEVDHVKELEFHPELALEPTNLRVLCKFHHNQRHNRFDGSKSNGKVWDDEKW